jgi:radical SAM protein with 4Fe4S-binding SPASM domain
MQKNGAIPDSNAVALDFRNFGYLNDADRRHWMESFCSLTPSEVPLPKKAIIELLNSCNFDCPMCRVGEYGVNLKRLMPLFAFEGVLDSMPQLDVVRLNGLGESTLVPGFRDYVTAVTKRKMRLELITNGSGDPDDYHAILQADGHVAVSFDGADAETFESLRRPAKWDAIVSVIYDLIDFKRKHSTGTVSILFTFQRGNIGHLAPLTQLFASTGLDNVIVNAAKLDNNAWLLNGIDLIRNDAKRALAIASEKSLRLFLPDQLFGQVLDFPEATRTCSSGCRMPWQEIVIRWNGDVQVCNMFNPYTYGNLHLNSVRDIWNNAFATLFRTMVNTPRRHPYCVGCVYTPEAYSK